MSIPVLFGFAAYLIFFVNFLYLAAFVGNLPWVPLTVDRGGPIGGAGLAAVLFWQRDAVSKRYGRVVESSAFVGNVMRVADSLNEQGKS